MLSDLKEHPIWKLESIWNQISKELLKEFTKIEKEQKKDYPKEDGSVNDDWVPKEETTSSDTPIDQDLQNIISRSSDRCIDALIQIAQDMKLCQVSHAQIISNLGLFSDTHVDPKLKNDPEFKTKLESL